jgi:hypothetical protein
MLNTNVGDMPLDIFCDYTSDILDEEWIIEHFIPSFGEAISTHSRFNYGEGKITTTEAIYGDGNTILETYGDGDASYGTIGGEAKGKGSQCRDNI